LVAGSWEWDYLAFGLAIPLEALDAAGLNRHFERSVQSTEERETRCSELRLFRLLDSCIPLAVPAEGEFLSSESYPLDVLI
jgi:hypothetical protein